MKTVNPKKSLISRSLDRIERIGNRLPHPVTLFALLAGIVLLISAIASYFELIALHPGSGEIIKPFNLLSKTGLRKVFGEAVTNFISFAPLGTVLVAMLGVGVAEHSGLISALLRKLVLGAPAGLITAAVVFAGIMSNLTSDAGYVVLVPLGAVIFAARGRHPLAGLAAAFAGVSGGFSANLLLSTLDPMLAGISEEAAQMIDPQVSVSPSANWYFMLISTFVITGVGTWVTEKIISPRLGPWSPGGKTGSIVDNRLNPLTSLENRGLAGAFISILILTVLILILTVPTNSLFRADNGSIITGATPLVKALVPLMALFFFLPGLVYGVVVKSIKSDNDVAKFMTLAMASMGGYIALAFAASQFVAYFGWSNLGSIMAIKGADFLNLIGFTGLPLVISFVVTAGIINLFIGSASAKWAIMAPVFVPLMMRLGYSPEFTQLAYRIGDSTTNIISPLMPYFAIVIAFGRRYDPKLGIGTLIATMLPYSIYFSLSWLILLIIWFLFNLPIGPGGTIYFPG